MGMIRCDYSTEPFTCQLVSFGMSRRHGNAGLETRAQLRASLLLAIRRERIVAFAREGRTTNGGGRH